MAINMNLVRTSSGRFKGFILVLAVMIVAIIALEINASAETYPGGSDNGLTSRISSLSSDLSSLGYGSTTDSDNWGTMWNRIKTSAKWTPNGDIAAQDVRSGKKFYNNSRAEQTGTMSMPGVCPTQAYVDRLSSANKTDNCVDDWPSPSDGIAGSEKQDPVTGLVWSQPLHYDSGNIVFNASVGSTFSWDSSGSNNMSRTSKQLCSDRGSGWRLPTQKELMQAYIDGSYYNLTNTDAYYGSATISYSDQYSSSNNQYQIFAPSSGQSDMLSVRAETYIRCVR